MANQRQVQINLDKLRENKFFIATPCYGGALTEDKKTWYPSEAAVKASLDKNIGKLTEGKKLSDFEGIKDFLRPNMVRISNSKNILIHQIIHDSSQ